MKIVYPGMFDPITLGHLDVINRASALFDEVIVAVANNSNKTQLFTIEQRVDFAKKAITQKNCSVVSFDGLLVDFMRRHHVMTMLRGLRTASDYDYESRIFYLNKTLLPELEVVFIPAGAQFQPISATFVRDMIKFGGDLEKFVPNAVLNGLTA